MEILTFRARSLREALRFVRHELAPDSSERSQDDASSSDVGLPADTGSTGSEPVSALRSSLEPRACTADESFPVPVEATDEITRAGTSTHADACPPAVWIPGADQQSFRDQAIRSVRNEAFGNPSLVDQLCRTDHDPNSLPEPLFHVLARLLEVGFQEADARAFLVEVRRNIPLSDLLDEHQIWLKLIAHVKSMIRIAGPIQIGHHEQRIVALVGATGVGKSTTIAKLAADFRLRQRRRVGLVTLDTYRIAAVDQLRAYANIMDVPLEVVAAPSEILPALARLSDQDLILVDTAGRNPFDELKLNELKASLRTVQPDETLMVLSATSSARAMIRTVQQFQRVGVTSIIVSKIDESDAPSDMLTVLRQCHCPLSYVTNGQSVPDDIQPADREQLISWIFRRPLHRRNEAAAPTTANAIPCAGNGDLLGGSTTSRAGKVGVS